MYLLTYLLTVQCSDGVKKQLTTEVAVGIENRANSSDRFLAINYSRPKDK